jgi:hypothetical protein
MISIFGKSYLFLGTREVDGEVENERLFTPEEIL